MRSWQVAGLSSCLQASDAGQALIAVGSFIHGCAQGIYGGLVPDFSHEDVLPEVALEPVAFPRHQSGRTPQATAVMLLAEFGLSPRAWLPSSALVRLLGDLGTNAVGARAVINRLARRAVLEGAKSGRHTSYRLTDAAAGALVRGGHAMASFARDAEEWDGQWTLVAFAGARQDDSQRRVLRGRLRWRGYTLLYDGLWISPQAPTGQLHQAVEKAERTDVTIFRARHLPLERSSTRDPLQIWDIDGVAAAYQAFLKRWDPVAAAVLDGQADDGGSLAGAAALRTRVEVEDDYRRFVVLDPRLPMSVMPSQWPRARARQTFATIYDTLAEPALKHVREVLADTGGADLVQAHTSAELLSGILLHTAPA